MLKPLPNAFEIPIRNGDLFFIFVKIIKFMGVPKTNFLPYNNTWIRHTCVQIKIQ